MKRARRRQMSRRMKRKAIALYHDVPRAYRYADHLTVCSCAMCGNPRRYFNSRTLQELRFIESAREQEVDLGDG